MIHFIHGSLCDVAEGLVVVEAAGVGYGIHVPATVIGALPSANTSRFIHIFH